MSWIEIIYVMIAVFFLTRLCFLKKEIKRATRQLHLLNKDVTAKKINVSYVDQDMEKLAKEINEQIDLTWEAQAEKKRTENELKQAISNMSHDIRTPMTSILGYIQLLDGEDLSEEKKREYTQIVRKCALRLKALLDDFFELSIIESSDYALSIEKIVLNDLLLESLVGFYEEFNKRHIEPSIQIPENQISIMADPSAVKRVIENLLTNAIRYSSGGVTIHLEKAATSARLTIRNPACQLSQEDLIFIFDRFYKADQPRTDKGTGLGLSIAKSLMLKMNGNLTAEKKGHELFMICEWKLAGKAFK